jgi:hypothetical protein
MVSDKVPERECDLCDARAIARFWREGEWWKVCERCLVYLFAIDVTDLLGDLIDPSAGHRFRAAVDKAKLGPAARVELQAVEAALRQARERLWPALDAAAPRHRP